MGLQVVRFKKDNQEQWGIVSGDTILVLQNVYRSLAEFLEGGTEEARRIKEEGSATAVSFADVELLSPVTKPARFICQGTNYASHRAFAPAGPILYLLDQDEVAKIHNLELNLWVNDELRQSANSSQLLFKPTETLTELSEMMDLSKGDLIITGTTGGVALNLSPEVNEQLANSSLSAQQKLEILLASQANNDRYLKDGDIIRCQIKSPDGSINLGEQKNKVVTRSKKPVSL